MAHFLSFCNGSPDAARDPAGSGNVFREEILRSGYSITICLRLLADIYDPQHAGFFNAYINGKKLGNLLFRIDPQGVRPSNPKKSCLPTSTMTTWEFGTAFHVQKHNGSAVANEDHRLIDIEHYHIDATIKALN